MIPLHVPGLWVLKGTCSRDQSPDDWFAERYEIPAKRAKLLCRGCPVRDECLSYAQTIREPNGIWGGYDPEERTDMRKTMLRNAIKNIA